MRTKEELKFLQSQSLDRKIMMTQARIMEFYNRMNGQVYISFSGGKDSTVLLDIARKMYPDIEAVYCDTGLEYPEIREFVKTKGNVTWLKPSMTFKEVIDKYGWCYPSKDVSQTIYYYRKGSKWASDRMKGIDKKGNPSEFRRNSFKKWKFLADSNFNISNKCCIVMKESPFMKYETSSGKKPILGTNAEESRRRKEAWLKTGCNSFDSKRPNSKPLSFWTEQDILTYLKKYSIPYCSVYGDIIEEKGKLKMSGEQRTGCMFCPIGCHLEKPVNKFQRMKETHPRQWEYCINKLELGKFLDFIGVPYGGERG